MDNWIFLFLGLILAYLLEFTRPWVKSFLQRNKLSLRNRNIKYIENEYARIEHYKNNHTALVLESIRLLAAALIQLTIFIFMVGLYVVSNSVYSFILVGLIGGGVVLDFLKIQAILSKTDEQGFDKYKETIVKKLMKLGGNPKDLDRERDD